VTDQATETTEVTASPERCFEIVTDFERYPEWAADIKQVTVRDRDPDGRPELVEFRAAAFGRSTSYTLRYDYSEAPSVLSWVQADGDLTSRLDGRYEFRPSDGGAEITYHLSVELKLPIPGFVKRRAEARIVGTALRELKARVES
jgi:ribosome-associated toxin RatA of RatAB toxin-antitoxin module